MPVPYDSEQHALLRQIAHKALLTPEEFPAFLDRVQERRIEVLTVDLPEWPPVKYAPLALVFALGDGDGGGGPWWVGRRWTGTQEAVAGSAAWVRKTKEARAIAKEMAGDRFSPFRVAYTWQVPEFDPKRHVVIRRWCAEHGVDIVRFWTKLAPKLRSELGRDPVVETTNPHVKAERATGSYSPTRRTLPVSDLPMLARLAGVTLVEDQAPVDDPSERAAADQSGRPAVASDAEAAAAQGASVATIPRVVVERWEDKAPFFHASAGLPGLFRRSGGRPMLVLRAHDGGGGEVRCWGSDQLGGGFILNDVAVDDFEPWGDGWRAILNREDWGRILRTTAPKPAAPPPDPVPVPSPVLVPERMTERTEKPTRAQAFTAGAAVYDSADAILALTQRLGRRPRLFSDRPTDSHIVALTRHGIDIFLRENVADRDTYVDDMGGRNYDCENFAERLRCNLQTTTGINGVGVIAGDRHAWSVFFVADDGQDGLPGILFVEPQTDAVVTDLSGQYSIERFLDVLI